MSVKSRILAHADDLVHLFGPGRIFFDEEILQLYAHDLSNPPKLIDLLIKRKPHAVVIPKDRDQIVALLRLATAAKIPVTPAGGRTSAYGGAMPVKGGIVADLSQLNKEITPDAAEETVRVDPGVLMWDLERELNRHGLMLRTYPTSAPSATIGGFVCQGGVGMGALQFGPIARQVVSVELVLPTGDVKTFSGKELDVVNECEGITGIVTKVTLKVAKKQEKVPLVATFDTARQLGQALAEIARTYTPWNVTFHNPTFSQLREEAGGPKTVPRKKFSALFVFTKDAYEPVKAVFLDAVTKLGGKLLPDAIAAAEWGEIFNTLRAKKLGPSIAPGEVVFPIDQTATMLETIAAKFDYAPLSIEGTLIQGGYVTILAFALDDERRPEYSLGFAAGIQLVRIGKKLGGRAYAPGFYLAAEAPLVFGRSRYDRIVQFKKAVDRSNIMNPGKIVGVRPPLMPPAPEGAPLSTVDRVLNFLPQVWAMSKLAPLLKYNRLNEERAARPAMFHAMAAAQGGLLGQHHDLQIYSCSQCGFCRPASPLSRAVGFEAGSPSGIVHWAKLYLQGRLRPTRKVADLVAAASETYVGDDVCPSGIPLSQVFKTFRTQLETDLGVPVKVPPNLKQRIAQAEVDLAEAKKRWATPATPPSPPSPPTPPAPASKPATPTASARPATAPPASSGPRPAAATVPPPTPPAI